MISFLKNFVANKLKAISYKLDRGMTYVELIVVLSIFSIMTSIAIFNYKGFQSKVDIKNLASDIALKIVEAQKSALSGKLSVQTPTVSPWKPSYGIYVDPASNKSFTYFVDLNNNKVFDGSNCNGECLEYVSITKGDYISSIDTYTGTDIQSITNPISISFKRPDTKALFTYSSGVQLTGFDYMQLTVVSPQSNSSVVKIYPSGRIQIN